HQVAEQVRPVRVPAPLLIGVWALLQVVFAYIGPAFGMVAWSAHIAGFVFGIVYGLYVRAAIARRLRKRHGF
ncbi:rhomboid family intramembrane serine protease, partial [Xanthomonas fragariae]|uniref:rhomboid family intramembrane serine protease n=1 Tax=Xanthomonas fragariae TaxID=48664 RepID=UPI00131EE45D